MVTNSKEINALKDYQEKTFEDIKHIGEFGNEYWVARELMTALGYSKWGNFKKVIDKAKISCKISGNRTEDCFAGVGKSIISGKGKVDIIEDFKLNRYACYLIVQNADSRKKAVALGQTYFAVQTRKMELTEKQFARLSEDEKRLYTRINVRNKNKYLFDTAKEAGVNNYGKFNNYGYRGLYNGETAQQIAARKGIDPNKEDILDHMGSAELGANLFRITQTDEILKTQNIKGEKKACETHHKVGQAVRQTIKNLGGRMPEKLPTPEKSIKEIEKEALKEIDTK